MFDVIIVDSKNQDAGWEVVSSWKKEHKANHEADKLNDELAGTPKIAFAKKKEKCTE